MKTGVSLTLLAFVMTAVALGTGVAAAQSSPNDVELSKQVDFITDAILVAYVTVSCQGATPTGTVTVMVVQAKPPLVTGTGSSFEVPVICDGTRRKIAVEVIGGPFQLGNAMASSNLLSPTLSDSDARSVVITKP